MKDIDLEYRIVGNGETTLILETGIGGSFYNWYSFIQEIKKDFTVILYHRAGYGNSPVSKKPRTTQNIAEELNNLVEELGITDKFILMGHSFGGLCAQQYALMYPHKIKGLILVDSTSYNFQKLYDLPNPVMNSLISVDDRIKINLNTSQQTKEELQLKYTDIINEYKKILPTQEVCGFEEFMTNPLLYKVIAHEFENFGESSKTIKAMGEFPQIPLIVIARDKEISIKSFTENDIPEEEAILYENVWRELQIELSQLSSKGDLVIAEGSDHQVHLDRPDVIFQCLKRFI